MRNYLLAILLSYSLSVLAVTTFDTGTNILTVDTVSVNNSKYRNAVVKLKDFKILTMGSSGAVSNSCPVPTDTFDPVNSTLNLNTVLINNKQLNNVVLNLKDYELISVVADIPSATQSNWILPPFNRWAVQNINQLLNVTTIDRGFSPVWNFNQRSLDIEAITYKNKQGVTRIFRDLLSETYTDGLLVLRKGEIVYEKYFNGQSQDTRHILFSASKSLVGTLGAMLVQEGLLDRNKLVSSYIPELKNSAYGDATVANVMDMTVGIEYSEDYADVNSEVRRYAITNGFSPIPDGYKGETTIHSFLASLKKKGEHGQAFHYVSTNTEVLAWLINRATGLAVSKVFSSRIWSKLGVERDAYVINDREDTESWGGGANATLRDIARFGQMILQGGQGNGQQIVPSSVINLIRAGGDKAAFAKSVEGEPGSVIEGGSYRDQWWVTHNNNGAFTAIGVFGQWIYIDPAAQMVIVKQSSYPTAAAAIIDDDVPLAFQAMGNYFRSLP